MNHVSKSILVTLISILAFSASFGRLTHQIELSYNPISHRLSVAPDSAVVYQGDSVIWKIKAGEDIQWFAIVGLGHPFRRLRTGTWSRLGEHVREDAPCVDWKYTIICKVNHILIPLHLDPKIAVKPAPSALINVILLLGLIVTTMTSIVFFSLWRITTIKLAKQIAAANPATNDTQNR